MIPRRWFHRFTKRCERWPSDCSVTVCFCDSIIMQTSLPDLPFTNYGDAVLDGSGIHSAAESSSRTYPSRTDLRTLTPWTSFPNDIHQAILSESANTHAHLPSTPFDISGWTIATVVDNEESIRAHATVALHVPAEVVLRKLGVNGRFAMPGGGNSAIVGDPDFSWVMSPGAQRPHPKVIVCVSVPTCVLVKPRWCRVGSGSGKSCRCL